MDSLYRGRVMRNVDAFFVVNMNKLLIIGDVMTIMWRHLINVLRDQVL